jgi:hypothetical protein
LSGRDEGRCSKCDNPPAMSDIEPQQQITGTDIAEHHLSE